MAWFGHSAVTVTAGPHQYLCVGAPFYKIPNTTDVVGAVYLYQLTTTTAATTAASLHATQATLVGTIVGTEHLAQFGHGMTLLHNNTLLAVSAPDAGSGSTGSTVCDCACSACWYSSVHWRINHLIKMLGSTLGVVVLRAIFVICFFFDVGRT